MDAKNSTSMIISLLKIRFSQIYRGIGDIGLFRAIVLLIILLPVLIVFLYKQLPTHQYTHIITGAWLVIIYFIHRSRKDYFFLAKVFEKPFWVYLSEYLFFSMPFMIMLAIATQYLHIVIFGIVLMGISFMVPISKVQRVYSKFIQYLPNGLYEWQSGFRKNLIPIIIFYLIGLLGFYSLWFSAVSLFFLTMTIVSFYAECEPRKILESAEINASKFIRAKLLNHTKNMGLLILPIFLVSLIHTDYWVYILISFFVVINLLIGSILLKYAYYYPNITSGSHLIIGPFAILLSVFLPISILFVFANIFLYHKSIQNLNHYLNAYN